MRHENDIKIVIFNKVRLFKIPERSQEDGNVFSLSYILRVEGHLMKFMAYYVTHNQID